jgi:hypothetical protein
MASITSRTMFPELLELLRKPYPSCQFLRDGPEGEVGGGDNEGIEDEDLQCRLVYSNKPETAMGRRWAGKMARMKIVPALVSLRCWVIWGLVSHSFRGPSCMSMGKKAAFKVMIAV